MDKRYRYPGSQAYVSISPTVVNVGITWRSLNKYQCLAPRYSDVLDGTCDLGIGILKASVVILMFDKFGIIGICNKPVKDYH